MMTMARKEIIQVNGAVVVIGMVIVANAFVVGIIDRFANFRYFSLVKAQVEERFVEIEKVRALKNEIVRLEGAPNWNATVYVARNPESRETGEE
jgi:hypothetical protein